MNKVTELFPGANKLSKPLFKSREEQIKWQESFYEKIAPEMEKLKIAQLNSIRDSLNRIVD